MKYVSLYFVSITCSICNYFFSLLLLLGRMSMLVKLLPLPGHLQCWGKGRICWFLFFFFHRIQANRINWVKFYSQYTTIYCRDYTLRSGLRTHSACSAVCSIQPTPRTGIAAKIIAFTQTSNLKPYNFFFLFSYKKLSHAFHPLSPEWQASPALSGNPTAG